MPATASLPVLKLCKCDNCSNVAISYDGYCKDHIDYHSIRSYNARPSASRIKDPIGIELEMYNRDHYKYLSCITPYVCRDGSLSNHSYAGEAKYVSSINKIKERAADIAQRARLAGNFVDKTCGFHVHCSLPNKYRRVSYNYNGYVVYDTQETSNTYEELMKRQQTTNMLFKFVSTIQDYFFDIAPPSRRSNGYCRKVNNISCLLSHYSWMSLSEHVPTMEVRLHGGTVNPWKIMGWLDVCIKLRECLHKICSNNFTNDDILACRRFSDVMPDGSIGKRYLLAREASPILTKFGF